MIKRFKRWGTNLVLVFTKEEERLFGLVEGDTITIDDMLWEEKLSKRNKESSEKWMKEHKEGDNQEVERRNKYGTNRTTYKILSKSGRFGMVSGVLE